MKYFNCSMSSSLFSSFQENTKCESNFFADTCTRSHTYLLSSVAFRLSKELNDALWFASLVLNEFSVSPTYVWGDLFVVLSLIVTVA